MFPWGPNLVGPNNFLGEAFLGRQIIHMNKGLRDSKSREAQFLQGFHDAISLPTVGTYVQCTTRGVWTGEPRFGNLIVVRRTPEAGHEFPTETRFLSGDHDLLHERILQFHTAAATGTSHLCIYFRIEVWPLI
jgi:hypothetical protein